MAWEPTESEPHMWDYWRDKKGLVNALEDYYPDTLKNDPEIGILLVQIKAYTDRIDKLMTERSEKWREENHDYDY